MPTSPKNRLAKALKSTPLGRDSRGSSLNFGVAHYDLLLTGAGVVDVVGHITLCTVVERRFLILTPRSWLFQ